MEKRRVAGVVGAVVVASLLGCTEPPQDRTLRPQSTSRGAGVADTGGKASEDPSVPGEELAQLSAKPVPAPSAATAQKPAPPKGEKLTVAAQLEKGKGVYAINCQACHQPDGNGLPGVFPPLAKADYLMADKLRSVKVVLHGLSGPVTVNGKVYNSMMPGLPHLSDADVAAVLTYVRNSWGNKGEAVQPDEVHKVRTGGGTAMGAER